MEQEEFLEVLIVFHLFKCLEELSGFIIPSHPLHLTHILPQTLLQVVGSLLNPILVKKSIHRELFALFIILQNILLFVAQLVAAFVLRVDCLF
jgi:hypothetical protein